MIESIGSIEHIEQFPYRSYRSKAALVLVHLSVQVCRAPLEVLWALVGLAGQVALESPLGLADQANHSHQVAQDHLLVREVPARLRSRGTTFGRKTFGTRSVGTRSEHGSNMFGTRSESVRSCSEQRSVRTCSEHFRSEHASDPWNGVRGGLSCSPRGP